MPTLRKSAAIMSVVAALGAAGAGAAQAATSKTESSTAARPHRPGLSAAQLETIATKLGVTRAQLQAAIDANRPTRPAGEKPAAHRDDLAAELASALGADAAKVKEILEANRPSRSTARPQGSKPAKPDHAKLIAALATGLNLDQATVKAAFDKLDAARAAEHEARHDAEYAAIAKALNVDADAVEAAFEAVRPAKPAR